VAEEKERIRIRLTNIRHPFNEAPDLAVLVENELGVKDSNLLQVRILRRSIDSRQERIDYVYTLFIELALPAISAQQILARDDVEPYREPQETAIQHIAGVRTRPVIIGCGPAGLFAAMTLVERGVQPIVVERGSRMAQRVRDVDEFWKSGKLDEESNVLFGEGGAGTFSDGKLTTRIKSPLKERVLGVLVRFGAPEEIIYINKPHLGTDRIRRIISRLVENLEQRGVEFMFNTRVQALQVSEGSVRGVQTKDQFIAAETVFLATGHSSRDVYHMLEKCGAQLQAKGFAMGLRIEHPQEFINRQQWGKWAGTPGLDAADYFLSYKDSRSGRGVYSFCMCPGGYVIACSSRQGELLTNGMSAYQRDSSWANAAIVVTVDPVDFSSQQPLAGIEMQRQLEEKTFTAGRGNFMIPAQTAREFVEGGRGLPVIPSCSCLPGAVHADLGKLLPDFLQEPLKRALIYFDKKIPGFIDAGTLFGVESRTSSPVRIQRNPHNFHALGMSGIIPIGEGSGYAGGIMSCAVDGIRAALCFEKG
jgi:uncharacterized FAD-dependent dehydrogenase